MKNTKLPNHILYSPIYGMLILSCILVSCKKLIEVKPPPTSINVENVYTTDANAIGVITGIYASMAQNIASGLSGISANCGLSADELQGSADNLGQNSSLFYTNALTGNDNFSSTFFWADSYQQLYIVNEALERITVSTTLTPSVKKQLIAECKFIRAFHYFYLVNLYGAVPLVTSSNYAVNKSLSRSSQSNIWHQITSDLIESEAGLSSTYLDPTLLNMTNERVRPTKWAAAALLARVYLYTNKPDSAEMQANIVIGNSALYQLTGLDDVFLKNSNEAIWQLQPVQNGENTPDGNAFILMSVPNGGSPFFLQSYLLNAFENGDQRAVHWVSSFTDLGTTFYFPYKYKVKNSTATTASGLAEYEMVFRLAEQYLIRAEARAMQNNLSGAQNDLNMIRNRAGLPNTTAADQATLLNAILHERQVELFTEWGNRWFDLKRTGTLNSVMGPPGNVCATKGGTWSTNWQLYPLPAYDIKDDPNLTQNPGY